MLFNLEKSVTPTIAVRAFTGVIPGPDLGSRRDTTPLILLNELNSVSRPREILKRVQDDVEVESEK